MKILFFIDSLRAGGKERRLTELMKGLRLVKGIDFEIVVMDENIHYKEVFQLNIKIHYLIRGTKKDFSVFSKFYRICKNYKPDIVHCWDSMTAVYSAPVCKLLDIQLVNSMVVDTPVKRNILNKNWFRAKLTFPFSKVIIGNSQAGIEAYNSPKKKSICIYNGFNFNRISKLDDTNLLRAKLNINGELVIGMVAAFEDRKDYTTVIKAATNFLTRNPDCVFLLIGEGEMKAKMIQMVPEQFRKKVVFLGKIDNVESYVNIFDIAVLCTNTRVHQEGISNSILEYMALGKPVIATSGGGTNEIIEDEKTGFLIDAFDSIKLEAKIRLLSDDTGLRSIMGLAGKERVKNFFSIDMMTDKYLSVYNRIL